MIKPVNGHILIEPIAQDSFIASQRDTYQEIGTVIAIAVEFPESFTVKTGDKVFFDAWLAKKYPKVGTNGEYYWLVKWEDITAIDYAE